MRIRGGPDPDGVVARHEGIEVRGQGGAQARGPYDLGRIRIAELEIQVREAYCPQRVPALGTGNRIHKTESPAFGLHGRALRPGVGFEGIPEQHGHFPWPGDEHLGRATGQGVRGDPHRVGARQGRPQIHFPAAEAIHAEALVVGCRAGIDDNGELHSRCGLEPCRENVFEPASSGLPEDVGGPVRSEPSHGPVVHEVDLAVQRVAVGSPRIVKADNLRSRRCRGERDDDGCHAGQHRAIHADSPRNDIRPTRLTWSSAATVRAHETQCIPNSRFVASYCRLFSTSACENGPPECTRPPQEHPHRPSLSEARPLDYIDRSRFATLAQLVEQRIRNAWVGGSSPPSGSCKWPASGPRKAGILDGSGLFCLHARSAGGEQHAHPFLAWGRTSEARCAKPRAGGKPARGDGIKERR